LIDLETHREVLAWVVGLLAVTGLVKGKRIGIDATCWRRTRPCDSIVWRDTGESYQKFLKKLAQQSGIATPKRDDLARVDRKREKEGVERGVGGPA
jgi:transposase